MSEGTTLTKLRLKNYRGFEDHAIPFRPMTILVGRNNAGKSTIVEALRFVSIITSRYRNLTYQPVPRWSHIPRGHRGVSPSLEGLEFSWEGLFHRYEDPPAEIRAEFSDGRAIVIELGPKERMHAVLYNKGGRPILDRGAASGVAFGRLATMPQVAPLQHREMRLSPEYVRRAADSYLAPLHFRNQLLFMSEHYQTFETLVAGSWPGLAVDKLEGGSAVSDSTLSLLLRERDFVAEVATMGHGLQMWLQTMWFFARTPTDAMVVLDEPDVYMHADLQRRLMGMLGGRYAQTIVATHSVEILQEVEPENILVIDRECVESKFTESLPAVQRLVSGIGTIQNIQLTRLWRARRCLILEGHDIELLAKFHSTAFPESVEPLRNSPHVAIEGWGGWQQAIGSRMLLRNAVDEKIVTLCVLDRDYHTDDEVRARQAEAEGAGVVLHVWGRKEIENYLLVPSAIRRVIAARAGRRTEVPSEDEIAAQLEAIVQELRPQITDRIVEHVFSLDKSAGAAKASARARELVQVRWSDDEGRLSLAPGKEVLQRLSGWSQSECGVGISVSRLAAALTRNELHAEVKELLRRIEEAAARPR